jgi:nicotinate-nucleotide pyrophosphorylase (carboxylating)
MNETRQQRLEKALFRGASLTLENPGYRHAVCTFIEVLLQTDSVARDLTVEALGIKESRTSAAILTREAGVVAGLAELSHVLQAHGLEVMREKNDGELIRPGDTLLRAEGAQTKLLSLERVGLNLLQRMSGIATAARCLQERARRRSPTIRIVGTRKTPWGLLDKRALHLAGAGTHRLGLGDAVVIKNNHLASLAGREDEAVVLAIERACRLRGKSAFIEVEVRGENAARAAVETFGRLLEEAGEEYPCLVMLDNMEPDKISKIVEMLQRDGLWDYALVEASGGISDGNVEAYANAGVDAISVGALTHSARALDLCQRIS